MRRKFFGLFLSIMVGACGGDPTPEEVLADCREDPTSECCSRADCGEGAYCNFSYNCFPVDDGVTCSRPQGDRKCRKLCGDTHMCDDPAQVCTTLAMTFGSDIVHSFEGCAAR